MKKIILAAICAYMPFSSSVFCLDENHVCKSSISSVEQLIGLSLGHSAGTSDTILGIESHTRFTRFKCKGNYSEVALSLMYQRAEDFSFEKSVPSNFGRNDKNGIKVFGAHLLGAIGTTFCLPGDYVANSSLRPCNCDHVNVALSAIGIIEKFEPNNAVLAVNKWKTSMAKDLGVGIRVALKWVAPDNEFTISPQVSAYIKVWGSLKLAGTGGALKDPERTFNPPMQIMSPILRAEVPVQIKIARRLFLNTNYSVMAITRSVQSNEDLNKLGGSLIEDRVLQSILVGISYSRV